MKRNKFTYVFFVEKKIVTKLISLDFFKTNHFTYNSTDLYKKETQIYFLNKKNKIFDYSFSNEQVQISNKKSMNIGLRMNEYLYSISYKQIRKFVHMENDIRFVRFKNGFSFKATTSKHQI